MDEYAALAQRVVLTMGDVFGCLVLSRDGLILAAFPEEDETILKPAWLRFVAMGEVRKSFVEFADHLWAFVHRGPYAAFVVASVGVRPGVLLDQLEQALLTAEEGRTKRDTLKVPDATAAPSGKPRTSLHPPAEKPAPAEVVAAAEPASIEATAAVPAPEVAEAVAAVAETPADQPIDAPAAVSEESTAAPQEAASGLSKEPQKLMSSGAEPGDGEGPEIDRVLLAKEFSGLLQLDSDGDEGSS